MCEASLWIPFISFAAGDSTAIVLALFLAVRHNHIRRLCVILMVVVNVDVNVSRAVSEQDFADPGELGLHAMGHVDSPPFTPTFLRDLSICLGLI